MGFVRIEQNKDGNHGYSYGKIGLDFVELDGKKYLFDECACIPEVHPEKAYRIVRECEKIRVIIANEVRNPSLLERLHGAFLADMARLTKGRNEKDDI